MFNKVLIANRGEIAVRVLRACRELGIQTVAVYSEADRNAMHVHYADEAYPIGAAPSKDSYLRIDKIIDAAVDSGAGAIHPGYGFLAERSEFAQACIDAGRTFIGPKPSSISAMGDKIIARSTMAKAGIPVVPGTEGDQDIRDDEMVSIARKVGFPLLIKASAGGGGKGIRQVNSLDDFRHDLESARRESEAAFGNGEVYLEKLIIGARHIEVQILADTYGNVIHLGERECSIQRRHQKLLEEAPSVYLADDFALREQIGLLACQAASAIDYLNAGTIEFLIDQEKRFYFLEMNTRLQVEHPITEAVTGVDIVREQIRIARGRKLSRDQSEVETKGCAVECRINAEDPYNNFLPSIGTITTSILPTGPGVRVDTASYTGYVIPTHYDSLISKVICWGETRGEALLRMRRALDEYHITGVKTTIPFHQKLLDSHRFMGGQFDTSFVDKDFQIADEDPQDPMIAAVIATLVAHESGQHAAQVVQRGARDASNWKWVGRWERMHR